MRACSALSAVVVLTAAALPASADLAEPQGVGGRVLDASGPLPAATVYAYQLAERGQHEVRTDGQGGFLFEELPAGLYKIIAHKPGFVPVVLRLTRATADAYQFIELQLAEAEKATAAGDADFWKVQAEIPPDVLRDMAIAELEAATRDAGWIAVPRAQLKTTLQAESGVDQIAGRGSNAQITGGQVGIETRVGGVRVGLRGDYLSLAPARTVDTARAGSLDGERSALSLEMASGEHTQVNLSSQSNHMSGAVGANSSFDFEQHRLSLSHATRSRSRSQLIAQYTAENNYHRLGRIEPAAIPSASQSWRVEGSYQTDLSHRSTFETGFRYHQLEAASTDGEAVDLFEGSVEERVDLYGRGGLRVRPAVLVQYGLYTTLRDGTVSLIPQGGVVLQLSPTWQASVLASHRLDDDRDGAPANGFLPAYFAETGECDQNEAQCYQLVFTHQREEDAAVSLGVTHREYGEVERVYFNEGFFNRLESLYLVPGDRVPEVHFAASRRITPTVLTRFESSVGSGGGGIFRADDRTAYENELSYLVTSLDTRFQATSTGLYLAFHRLNQVLATLDESAQPVEDVEVERLQLRVTQDLGFLRQLAADWALKLDMELSRGTTPYATDAPDDEIRKRLLGGIAVSF